MIDLHTHILPQMDDGSKSVEETAALLMQLRQQGVTTVVATPHFYPKEENPQIFLERREKALSQVVLPEGGPEKLLVGAEVAYFSGIGSSDALEKLRIGDTRLLLIEMPFADWSDWMISDICEISDQQGLIPVLAHINRYHGRNQFPRFMNTLAASGVLFQCNAEAFSGFRSRRLALNLLKNGNIHFLGTDCHNLTNRPPLMGMAQQEIIKKLGMVFLRKFDKNAETLLSLR